MLEDWWPLLEPLLKELGAACISPVGLALLALCTLLSASWFCCGLVYRFCHNARDIVACGMCLM